MTQKELRLCALVVAEQIALPQETRSRGLVGGNEEQREIRTVGK